MTQAVEARTSPPLGAILAGGASRRFGAPKATAQLGGRPLIRWVYDAVAATLAAPVVITADAALGAMLGAPVLRDRLPGGGPLSGLHAALLAARAAGRPGVLCVGCDTPFLEPRLLRRLIERFARSSAELVAPESGGPRGIEPLCAVYAVGCVEEIERRLRSGPLGLSALAEALSLEPLPLDEVRRLVDPRIAFLNVNTPGQLELAESLTRQRLTHARG